MRSALTATLAVLALGALAGCGAGDESVATLSITSTPSTPSAPGGGGGGGTGSVAPPGVPTTSEGKPADAASARVIRGWSRALGRGDVRRAAWFFALPSRVRNGASLVLDTPGKRVLFNAALPCGARPTKLERAQDGYTIVDYQLGDRPGPGGSTGGCAGPARTAIRVRDGRIVDWYRLENPPSGTPGTPPSPPPESSPDGPARIT